MSETEDINERPWEHDTRALIDRCREFIGDGSDGRCSLNAYYSNLLITALETLSAEAETLREKAWMYDELRK